MTSTSVLRTAWAPACTPKGDVFLAAYAALDTVLEHHQYQPTAPDCGAYNCRKITGGNGYSLHAYGPGDRFTFWTGVKVTTALAVDLNWQDNPYGPRLVTDMPRQMVDDVLRIRTRNGVQVWRWGGDYRGNKDAMHFEIVCVPRDLGTGIDPTTLPGHKPTPAPIPKDWFDMASEADLKKLIAAAVAPLAEDLAECKRQLTVSDEGKGEEQRTVRHITASTLNKV